MISERIVNAALFGGLLFAADWYITRTARKVRERSTRRMFTGNRQPR